MVLVNPKHSSLRRDLLEFMMTIMIFLSFESLVPSVCAVSPSVRHLQTQVTAHIIFR